jgi:hypothetical protein
MAEEDLDVSIYASTLQDDFEIEEDAFTTEHERHAPPEVECVQFTKVEEKQQRKEKKTKVHERLPLPPPPSPPLSLSHTHTHTHTISLSLYLSHTLCPLRSFTVISCGF